MTVLQDRATFLDPDNSNGLVYYNKSGVLSYLSPKATLDPHGGIAADTNTLCVPDVSLPEWRNGLFGGSTLTRLPAQATIDTLLDGVWVNAQQDVVGDVPLSYYFVVSPGCTSLAFQVPMRMPVVTGTANVTLRIYSAGGGLLFTQTFAVATTRTMCTATVTTLVPGTSYIATIHVNEAAQNANPYIGRVALTPTGGTGTFASAFARLRVQATMVAGSIQAGWNNGLYPYTNPNADIFVHTDSTSMAVESYASSMSGAVALLYSGQPALSGAQIANGSMGIDDFPLPFAGFSDTATIRTGTSLGNIANTLGKYQGIFPRAIYLPVSASYLYTPFTTRDLCVIFGDSLVLGNASGSLPFESWGAHFRLKYAGNVAIDAHNSRTLFDYASTPAKQDSLARYASKCGPRIIIWDLSVNDYVTFPWAGGAAGCTAMAAALANTIDLCRDRYSPQTRHIIKTACRLTNEADRGNGTLAAFRAAMTAIGTGRAAYVTVIDGTSLMAVGDIDVDGIHMTTVGQAKVGSGMVAALAALVPPEV